MPLRCPIVLWSRWLRLPFSLIALLLLPLGFGYTVLFLDVIRGIKLDFARLFDGFKDYGRILGTMLLTTVYTFLWTLLLVIPGIMKSYSYAMTLFILKDYPELQYDAAIEKSNGDDVRS